MKKAILIISSIFCFISLEAQNIECIGNTINIPLSGYKAGKIQWQFSSDKNTWINLTGKTTTNLQYNVLETGYFRAKVTYGQCDYFSDTTFIKAFPVPTISDAGIDIYIKSTDTTTVLSANNPVNGKGKWSILTGIGGSFENDTIPNSRFTGRFNSDYKLRWTISNGCKSNMDDVNVGFHFEFLPPSNLNIRSIAENKLELSWIDNCQFEKGLKLERSINDSSFIEIAVLDSNKTSFVDSFLTIKNSISYRLRAYTEKYASYYSVSCKASWKVSGVTFLRSLSGHFGPIWAVAVSPDGKYVASGSGSGEGAVKIWNSSDGTLIRTISNLEDVRCVQFSPDGSILAASAANFVKLIKMSDGSIIRTLYGESGLSTPAFCFSPDGQIIIDGSASKKIHIWNVNNGQLLKSLSGSTGTIWSVAVSPDGTEIASGAGNQTSDRYDTYLRFWNLSDGSQKDSLNNNTILTYNVRYSPDGKYIACTTTERNCYIWTKERTKKYSLLGSEISFKPNTNWLSIVENSGFKFFNIDKGVVSISYPSGQSSIESIDFGSNNILVTGSYDKSVKLWSISFAWTKE